MENILNGNIPRYVVNHKLALILTSSVDIENFRVHYTDPVSSKIKCASFNFNYIFGIKTSNNYYLQVAEEIC